MDVAVKTVKSDASIEYLKALLKETKVMIYIGKHPNIAEFVGCCTKNLEKGRYIFFACMSRDKIVFKNI